MNKGLITIIESELITSYEDNTDYVLVDDYAKDYGRPPLSKVPYGSSENDFYPYLEGHAPNCNGKIRYGLVRNKFGNLDPTKCWCGVRGFIK
jgi:hypothetical protein